MRPSDAFWAGRIVSRLGEDAVRAIVRTGGYADPEAERHLGDVLLRRRDKVIAWTFGLVNPLAEFTASADPRVLRFRNLGEQAGLLFSIATYF